MHTEVLILSARRARPTASRRPSVVLAAALCSLPALAVAQESTAPDGSARFHIGAHGGVLTHSLLGVVTGTLTRPGSADLSLNVDVEGQPSPVVGGFVGWHPSPSVGLRARVARAATHMAISAIATPVSGPGLQAFEFDELGEVGLWLLGVELTWLPRPAAQGARPHLSVGFGASNWRITGLEDLDFPPLLESPVNLRPVETTLPTVTVGGGLTFALGGAVSALVEISDHISGNPFADDDFRIGSSFAGIGQAKDLVHSLSFSAGLRVGLGG
jgi:hypothetical protein